MLPDEDLILDTHPSWKNIIIGAGFSGNYGNRMRSLQVFYFDISKFRKKTTKLVFFRVVAVVDSRVRDFFFLPFLFVVLNFFYPKDDCTKTIIL